MRGLLGIAQFFEGRDPREDLTDAKGHVLAHKPTMFNREFYTAAAGVLGLAVLASGIGGIIAFGLAVAATAGAASLPAVGASGKERMEQEYTQAKNWLTLPHVQKVKIDHSQSPYVAPQALIDAGMQRGGVLGDKTQQVLAQREQPMVERGL